MQISGCRTYHSQTEGRALLRMADGLSVFKVYYLSLIGRTERARYEWGQSTFGTTDFEALFQRGTFEGVGFVTAFPHITKVFRYAPTMETVLHVTAFNTRDLSPLNLGREEGYMEFACLAEAVIAADEYRAWANALTVGDYLRSHSPFKDGPIIDPAKLFRYWDGQESAVRT